MIGYAYYARFSYSFIISNILYLQQDSQNMHTLHILKKNSVFLVNFLFLA